jgi:hypothetical protein
MAQLTKAQRDALPASAFVFPKTRRYPIHDKAHAANALARSAGKPEAAVVRAAVAKRYPGLKHDLSQPQSATIDLAGFNPRTGKPYRYRHGWIPLAPTAFVRNQADVDAAAARGHAVEIHNDDGVYDVSRVSGVKITGDARPTLRVLGQSKPTIHVHGTAAPHISALDASLPTIHIHDAATPTIHTMDNSRPDIHSYGVSPEFSRAMGSVLAYGSSAPTLTAHENSFPVVTVHDNATPTVKGLGTTKPTVYTPDWRPWTGKG